MEQLSRSEMVAQMKKNVKSRHKYIKHKKTNVVKATTPVNIIGSESDENKSFQFRIVLASFIFLLFLGMQEMGVEMLNLNSSNIIEVITDNSGMESAEEFVIATFNSLD